MQDDKAQKYFIRFGEIPKDERSVIFHHGEPSGYEEGVSVYEAHNTISGKWSPVYPVPSTDYTFDDYNYYLHYARCREYLVTGDIVGIGSDGEPLIKNIKIVEELPRKIKQFENKDNL